jgi:hypothetical protein
MKNLSELKLSLAKRILDCENEEQLRTVDQLLDDKGSFKLNAKQKANWTLTLRTSRMGRGELFLGGSEGASNYLIVPR